MNKAHFDLQRFVDAQDADGTYEKAIGELQDGKKTSHWMWFVFPQIAGLGRSETARRYALESSAEASAYLEHELLGQRLVQCCEVLLELPTNDADEVFGSTDAMKLRSCMTLFMRVQPDEPLFAEVLNKFFGGAPDKQTDELL